MLSTLVGVPLGALLALRRFRGRRAVITVVHTGMGLPPVVVGLGVSLLLWRTGFTFGVGLRRRCVAARVTTQARERRARHVMC